LIGLLWVGSIGLLWVGSIGWVPDGWVDRWVA
jgi:hypothetical protein